MLLHVEQGAIISVRAAAGLLLFLSTKEKSLNNISGIKFLPRSPDKNYILHANQASNTILGNNFLEKYSVKFILLFVYVMMLLLDWFNQSLFMPADSRLETCGNLKICYQLFWRTLYWQVSITTLFLNIFNIELLIIHTNATLYNIYIYKLWDL